MNVWTVPANCNVGNVGWCQPYGGVFAPFLKNTVFLTKTLRINESITYNQAYCLKTSDCCEKHIYSVKRFLDSHLELMLGFDQPHLYFYLMELLLRIRKYKRVFCHL